MDFFKALIPSTLLTFVVSALMGKGGSHGGFLSIHRVSLLDHSFYWSWILFGAATVLAWILFAITPK